MKLSTRRGFMAAAIITVACGGGIKGTAGTDAGSPEQSGGSGGVAEAGADADACASLIYLEPGCGADAPAPLCFNGSAGACAAQVCTCTGKTAWANCGFAYEPFRGFGDCEAGTDGSAP